MGLALVDELELEVVGADGYGLGVSLGDDADAEAAETTEGDAEAVVGGEAFGLDAVAVGVWDDEDLAVGEDAVDVEDEYFDVFGAGFSGHSMMIPWRAWKPPAMVSRYMKRLAPVSFHPDVWRKTGRRR